jgi:uncharacterized spore protein YtfJ
VNSAGAVVLASAVVLVSTVEVRIVELEKSDALTEVDEWTDEWLEACDIVELSVYVERCVAVDI